MVLPKKKKIRLKKKKKKKKAGISYMVMILLYCPRETGFCLRLMKYKAKSEWFLFCSSSFNLLCQ